MRIPNGTTDVLVVALLVICVGICSYSGAQLLSGAGEQAGAADTEVRFEDDLDALAWAIIRSRSKTEYWTDRRWLEWKTRREASKK